jgi:hypothetical protein
MNGGTSSEPGPNAAPGNTRAVTIAAVVDRAVGQEIRHQVWAYALVLQLAAGAPSGAEPAPLPGEFRADRMTVPRQAAV